MVDDAILAAPLFPKGPLPLLSLHKLVDDASLAAPLFPNDYVMTAVFDSSQGSSLQCTLFVDRIGTQTNTALYLPSACILPTDPPCSSLLVTPLD